MQKEMISMRQAFCIIAIFIWGSSVVMGGSSEAGQDSWLSLLLAFAIAVPLLVVYGRLMRLYPEKNIFDILLIVFGKIAGSIIILLISWYALHLCSVVLCNFSQFIEIVAMPETPQLPLLIVMLAVTTYLAMSGVETLGRWAVVSFPVVIAVVIGTIIMAMHHMDFSNILPVMSHKFSQIADGSLKVFSFPFAETVLFLGVADAVKKQTNPYKLYVYATAFGALILLLVMLRNIELLGSLAQIEYFPSYIAARIIDLGDVLTRIEGTISMNFIISGVTKITVCLLVAAKGAAYLLRVSNYRRILIPVSALSLALSTTLYSSAMQMFGFISVYPYYAMPFQVFIPIVVWLLAEIKVKRQKKLAAGR